MSTFTRVVISILAFSFGSALAQESAENEKAIRELLVPIDAEKRSDLMSRHALNVLSLEYFAKEEKFDIYEVNIDALEAKDEMITITPFNEQPIQIFSKGIRREPDTGWVAGYWTGEIPNYAVADTRENYPLELGLQTWAIDSDGNLVRPDPNREYTLSQLGQENAIIPEESYLRRNEKLVYSITGSIPLPHLKRQLSLSDLEGDLDVLIVYEVDREKAIPRVSDTRRGRANEPSERKILREQKLEAYRTHVENVKRDLGITENQE